jgi:cytochrome c peroxidase
MDTDLLWHVGMGAGITLLACLALLFMVYREMAPTGGLGGRGRVYLTAAVGLGVLAFAAKVAVLAVMSAVPQHTVVPLSALHEARRQGQPSQLERVTPPELLLFRPDYVWRTLPGTASGEVTPLAAARVALGKRLFHDTDLSLDRTVACAACHDVEGRAGVDGRPTSRGIGGQLGGRNAPTVWNAAYQAKLFWDGRAPSLEEQAKGPPVNPVEMGMHRLEDVVARVAARASYRQDFDRVFGVSGLGIEEIVAAIAAYERTLVTPDTPYDRYVRGDAAALSPAQKRGMARFADLGCVVCHHGPNFSSASHFDPRAPFRMFPAFSGRVEAGRPESGAALVRRYRLDEDGGRLPAGTGRGLWRVPSLRNVALTGPWFHNGAVTRLEDAVRIMAAAQLGLEVGEVRDGRRFTEADIRDIAAFLKALGSERLAAGMLAGPASVAKGTYPPGQAS